MILTSNANGLSAARATSANATIVVNSIPVTPGGISGVSTICSGTSNIYSVTAVESATFYTWTLPGG